MTLEDLLSSVFLRALSRMRRAITRGTFTRRSAKGKESGKRSAKLPLHLSALATDRKLWTAKLTQRPKSFSYPYTTLSSFGPLGQLLADCKLDLLNLCQGPNRRVADIGAGDGDVAFFLEIMGLFVEAIDFEATNYNRMEGIRILKQTLNSSVSIQSIDLDSQFSLPGDKYDAIFLLGTLYHLKNPFFVLENLAGISKYCFLSTRVARKMADGISFDKYPVAYLVEAGECNDDSTNFWIFSTEGLKRLIQRAGWNLLAYTTTGDTTNSTPADPSQDERAFCILKSRNA